MRPFASSDYAEVAGWYEARGLPAPPAWSLPSTGRIEPGIAAGFMWRTDSGIALFDGWISNPAASPFRAARALVAASDELTEEARRLGFRLIRTWTRVRGIERSGHRNAFKSTGAFTMMVKAISPASQAHNSTPEA